MQTQWRTSEELGTEFYSAYFEAVMSMGGAGKDAANPFYDSKYADFNSILRVVKPACHEAGLVYIQIPVNHPESRIPGIITRIVHVDSAQWVEGEFYLTPTKNDPQQMGSAITYLKRYALQAMFGIPSVDDDAEAAMLSFREPSEEELEAQAERVAEVWQLLVDTNTDAEKFAEWLGVEKLSDMDEQQYDNAVKSLNNRKARQQRQQAAAKKAEQEAEDVAS